MPAPLGLLPVTLPHLASDTALIAATIIFLSGVALAARSVLAYQALSRRADVARAAAQRFEAREQTVGGSIGALRERVRTVDAGAERALWSLPHFDARLDEISQTLADDRALLVELGRDDGRALRQTLSRIRGTLSLLGSASGMRRKFRA